jgi:SpoVK/Ycf46/Vps4 family AAA+-type ATPase
MCRPYDLDEAARRRLVKRIYIPLPDPQSRKQIITSLLRKANKVQLTLDEIDDIVKRTEAYSNSDLTAVCKDAALGPIRELGMKVQDISPNDIRAIAHKVFHSFFVLFTNFFDNFFVDRIFFLH